MSLVVFNNGMNALYLYSSFCSYQNMVQIYLYYDPILILSIAVQAKRSLILLTFSNLKIRRKFRIRIIVHPPPNVCTYVIGTCIPGVRLIRYAWMTHVERSQWWPLVLL